jgi:hypothetical protein
MQGESHQQYKNACSGVEKHPAGHERTGAEITHQFSFDAFVE